MTYHIIIATERRTSTPENPHKLAIPVGDQLHMTDAEILNHLDDTNIVYVAEWDQRSPWVVIHKGADIVPNDVPDAWPTVDQATWQAANPTVIP